MINFFGIERTRACLESLRDQGLTCLRLIDNSADEGEWGRLQALVGEDPQRRWGLPVRLMRSPTNLGFAAAVNRAIAAEGEAAGHRYYLLLNNDAELSPGALEALTATAGRDQLGLVTPLIERDGAPRGFMWYHRRTGHLSQSRLPGAFAYPTGCCLLVDRRLVVNGALLDEAFFMYGEDVALCARAARAGLGVGCESGVCIRHLGSGSARHGSLFYEYHVARGHWLLIPHLARSSLDRVSLVVGRVLYLPARALLRALRHRSLVPLRALVLLMRPGCPGPRPAGAPETPSP